MNICVGIVGEHYGWQLLLEQEGIPYDVVEKIPSPEEYSVLAVRDNIAALALAEVKAYLRDGGAVICSGKTFSMLTGSSFRTSFVKYLRPEQDSLFAETGLVDINAACTISATASSLRTNAGSPAVALEQVGNGHIIALPFDAGDLILDGRFARKSFYAERNRLPHERVSAVSRGGIRTLVSRALEILHHRRGLPYVHLWRFPENARSIFAFRIDTDFATAQEITDLYDVSKKTSVPCTWFVHVKGQEKFLRVFSEMEGHEVGAHCFDHVVYNDVEKDIDNIRRAVTALETSGIHPKSFAAPYGTWTKSMANAIEHFKFEYSSEFSYDYDNLPSYPVAAGGTRMTLQVPVHPISIGSLRRQGFTSTEMKAYFAEVCMRKLHHREPLFFYHHPKNAHQEALESLFEFAAYEKLPMMRMIDFARWWKQREHVKPVVRSDGSILRIDSKHADERVWLRITRDEKSESILPMKESIDTNLIEWNFRPAALSFPADIARSRKFNPYIVLNRLEDMISKTLHPRS